MRVIHSPAIDSSISGMLEFFIIESIKEEHMADFAYVEEPSDSGPVYINLDYVTRIYTGLDPREPTEVVFRDGSTMIMSRSEGVKLLAQLNLCCRPRPAARSGASARSVQQAAGGTAPKASTPRRAAKRAG